MALALAQKGRVMATRLELQLLPGAEPGLYRVEVVRSAAGDATGEMHLDAQTLLTDRDNWTQSILASSASRRSVSPTEQPLRTLGTTLFNSLFASSEIAEAYRICLGLAESREESLSIALRISTPELVALPWESLYDHALGAYLSRREPLVRRIPVSFVSRPKTVDLPLRVLGIVSSPRGLPLLDTDGEKERLESALADRIQDGSVLLHWAEPATWYSIQDLLLRHPWHVIHFIGHGDFDLDRDEGILSLVGENGRANNVEASRFADLLKEARPVPQLVVLNSCSGAASGASDLFAGTASSLVRSGITAVAAMQFEITDQAAIAFARGFYAALSEGRGIDDAVKSGRISILGSSGSTLEWITPVVYLRGDESQIFEIRRATGPDIAPSRPEEQSGKLDAPPSRPEAHSSIEEARAGVDEAIPYRAGVAAKQAASRGTEASDSNLPDTAKRVEKWWARVVSTARTESAPRNITVELHLADKHKIVIASAGDETITCDDSLVLKKIWYLKGDYQVPLKDHGTPRIAVLTLSRLPGWWSATKPQIYNLDRLSVDGQEVSVRAD